MTNRRSFRSKREEQGRRSDRRDKPSHLNVILSKAALSGPSVCLRARAPCPLRVSCPGADRAESAQLSHSLPWSRSSDRVERAAQLQALAFRCCPWVKTSPTPKTHPPTHQLRRQDLSKNIHYKTRNYKLNSYFNELNLSRRTTNAARRRATSVDRQTSHEHIEKDTNNTTPGPCARQSTLWRVRHVSPLSAWRGGIQLQR